LVVIAIIGILSGLIIVGMNGMTQKATIAKAQVFSNSLRNSLMMNTVGEWKLDEASGTAANDTWTKTNNGVLTNFANTTAGYGDTNADGWMSSSNCISGTCLKFDGANDYVDCGSSINIVSAYTVEEWIKMSANTGNTNEKTVSLGATVGSSPFFSPNFWNTNKPLIYLNSSNYRYGSTNVADNNWHHIVFVVVGTAQNDILNAKIYVDGKEEVYGSVSNSNSPVAPSHIWIGANDINTFSGSLDDIRIYNTVIPTSQIKEKCYAGLNNLLVNGQISIEEYSQRINSIAEK
jgi:type II secretory pathway pseudopilin PulG